MHQYKYHPILERPHHKHRIVSIHYYCDYTESILDHFIDIQFKKDQKITNIRFIAPRYVSIKKGFPYSGSGFSIIDIKDQQMEGMNIKVINDEAEDEGITFYANAVIDLDDENNKYLIN